MVTKYSAVTKKKIIKFHINSIILGKNTWHVKWIYQTEVEYIQSVGLSVRPMIYMLALDIHANIHIYVNPFTDAVDLDTYIIKLLMVTWKKPEWILILFHNLLKHLTLPAWHTFIIIKNVMKNFCFYFVFCTLKCS